LILIIIRKEENKMVEKNNVTYAKPAISGAISTAPVGTPLPTDAKSTLDPKFKSLGYISEEGLTNENSPESEIIKAWGGDGVVTVQKSKEDTFKVTLIEAVNIEVLKAIYGKDNVTGTLKTGITVKANNKPTDENAYVIDMIYKGNILKRIVIPRATVFEVGEIAYKDNETVGYETTLNCIPNDEDGNTHFEYIIEKGE